VANHHEWPGTQRPIVSPTAALQYRAVNGPGDQSVLKLINGGNLGEGQTSCQVNLVAIVEQSGVFPDCHLAKAMFGHAWVVAVDMG
jgi:hypothetical protein